MSVIAKMVKLEDGSFEGQLNTLFMDHPIRLEPITTEKTKDNQPTFRAHISGCEAGAGWNKTSKKDKPYISITLDCPSLAKPIYANLHEKDGEYNLLWSR